MADIQGHEIIPSARRLVTSLRDLGYDFSSAVADLVDNAIEAKATKISIDVEFDGDDSWVRIVDNGRGMAPADLKEALRYGAERDYNSDDLGKFGLGLKTASMSQCQRLTVGSRVNSQRADIHAFSWDLDHIKKSNRWEILPIKSAELNEAIKEPLKTGVGTVVLWQRLDRILGFKHPYGEQARKRLNSMCRELEEHLGMVFHKFLSGEVGKRKLKIFLNGNKVQPWDPFARDEKHTQQLQPVMLELIEEDSVVGEILIEPYVLPHQDQFSTQKAHSHTSGPKKWNRQQGFYIYRAGRMIQSGGWSGIRTLDEHHKLARISLSFLPDLDEAFKINVAKMKVQLPGVLRSEIEQAISPTIRMADKAYRKSAGKGAQKKHLNGNPKVDYKGGSGSSGKVKEEPPYSPSETTKLWTLDELVNQLLVASTSKEKPVVETVVKRVKKQLKKTK